MSNEVHHTEVKHNSETVTNINDFLSELNFGIAVTLWKASM